MTRDRRTRKDGSVRHPARSGPRIFGRLLFKGQRVDWRHSLVVVLVITGMFSTPLVLGSIRNRVYVAVRDQIEKENNVREITLHLAREDAPPLDDLLIQEIESAFTGVEAVGNHKVVVSVEGPEGADFLTLQTLVPGDPRQASLQVTPEVPADFALTDLVVSDGLGELLYGDSWESHWRSGEFEGPPLALAINDLPLEPEFRVATRRRLPGRGLYASLAAGGELRRYTEGLGASRLGLSADPDLVAHALPKLASTSCLLLLDPEDATCDEPARDRLLRRLGQLRMEASDPDDRDDSRLLSLPELDTMRVRLDRRADGAPGGTGPALAADCREVLAPHLVETCSGASVFPELDIDLFAWPVDGDPIPIGLSAVDVNLWSRLPSSEALADQHGTAPVTSGRIGLAAPEDLGLAVGDEIDLGWEAIQVPGRVERLYGCPDGECPVLAAPLDVFRLQNLADGLIEISSREPLTFVPVHTTVEYDEVLAYAPRVEDVERLSAALQESYPGYSVQYNAAALDKLTRQDSRLSTLFTLTIALSALFIVLALGALARINIERRRRQMAQMLILGFSRGFVRRLITAEYLLLTTVAALTAAGLTAGLCAVARRLLSSAESVDGGQGFEVIVQSMAVDPVAFVQVLAVVAVCTWIIAVASARKAARTDPLDLLD